GIGFKNPDFMRNDAEGRPTSCSLYFWDTTRSPFGEEKPAHRAPASYPNGVPIGSVYTQDELTAGLRSAVPRVPAWDTVGHGTACASVAAGNNTRGRPAIDQKDEPVGVAPDADLLAVRLGERDATNIYLLGCICDWIDKLAGPRPVVISCSFGIPRGGRDGTQVLERQLDARFPPDTKSRVICVAAGNDGLLPLHAAVAVEAKAEKPSLLKWNFPRPGRLTLYF